MKKKITSIFLILALLFMSVSVSGTDALAKEKYINNKNFRGTFTSDGEECTLESGGYEVVIGNISSDGTVKLQLHRWSANVGHISETGIITEKIKGNKVSFTFIDGYDCSKEKGTITFNKDKTIFLKVKVLEEVEFSGYSLRIDKTRFERANKKHKLYK